MSEGPKTNTKRLNHTSFVDEATSSIDVLGGYNDQWNCVSSTEKWTFEQNSWQDLLYVVEIADQRNYFSSTINTLNCSIARIARKVTLGIGKDLDISKISVCFNGL